MKLHFVRHGQSVWNAQGRAQGQTPHVPLTARGRAQALAAARALAGCGATVVYTSDLRRAVQTAEPIAATLGVPVRRDAALREQALGVLEGRRSAELWAADGAGQADWADPDWRPDGGESTRDVWLRVSAFLGRLAAAAEGDAVLVTHGDTMRIALGALRGEGPDEIGWTALANGAIVSACPSHW